MLEWHRIYYNFIRPHMALDGKTPAQEAGLNLGLGDNRWKGLIEKAIQNVDHEPKKIMNKENLDYWF